MIVWMLWSHQVVGHRATGLRVPASCCMGRGHQRALPQILTQGCLHCGRVQPCAAVDWTLLRLRKSEGSMVLLRHSVPRAHLVRCKGAYRGSEETAGATQTPPTAHPESGRWAGSCPATVCAPLSIRLVTDCMPAACERIHVATDGGGDRSPKPHLLRLPPRPIPHRAPCFAVGGGSIFDRHGVTRCLWGKARARR